MESALTIARHFARLVWLLLHESGAIVEQKSALRAILELGRRESVLLSTEGMGMYVNDVPVPDALAGVQDLAAQLLAHGIVSVHIQRDASPADVLGLARILAGDPVTGDRGRALSLKLRALGATTVQVQMWDTPRSSGESRRASGEVGGHAIPPGRATGDLSVLDPNPIDDDNPFYAFTARPIPDGNAAQLLARVDESRSVNATLRALDEVVTLAEDAQREGHLGIVGAVFHGLVARERAMTDSEMRRAFIMAIRRMTRPTLLRALVRLLVERNDKSHELMEVLDWVGEDGADMVIETLNASEDMSERRIYFDALSRLAAAVPTLVHMLGDARWYVARNAADLLGELQAAEGEIPLIELLRHADDRVRRAAVGALTGLGTPRAMQAVHGAIRDRSPQVRMQVAVGLASRRGQASVVTLMRALDEESDPEVQQTIMVTLGRVGTPEAIAKLAKVAEPEGWLFRKKPTPIRVQAIRALGEARRTPAAVSALQSLQGDREREVREAASRALEDGAGGGKDPGN